MSLVLKRKNRETVVIFPTTLEPITITLDAMGAGAVKLLIDGDPRDRVLRGELLAGDREPPATA